MAKSVKIRTRLLAEFDGDLTNVIVRYPNRKLYDYALCDYVTLGDILDRIKGKQDFTVVDSSGDNITNSTIALVALKFGFFDNKLTKKVVAHIAA